MRLHSAHTLTSQPVGWTGKPTGGFILTLSLFSISLSRWIFSDFSELADEIRLKLNERKKRESGSRALVKVRALLGRNK